MIRALFDRFVVIRRILLTVATALLSGAGTACAQQPAPMAAAPIVDPKADALLKQMSQTLASAKEFSFETVSLTDEVTPLGQKIQYSKHSKIAVRRPNAVRAVVNGDKENFTADYDGKTFTIYDPTQHQYSVVPMPDTIDAAVDTLATKYGIVAPVADLLFSNPYESFTGRLEAGIYLGEHEVDGKLCHHLAFRQTGVDWQIWLDAAADQHALPRKLVITYKTIPGEPEYVCFISNWDLAPKFVADTFKFEPPAGSKRVDLPTVSPEAAPTSQPSR